MNIIIKDYPCYRLIFETLVKLPKFDYGCPTRTKILHDELIKQNVDLTFHHVNDYIVECVDPIDSDTELWLIGS